MKCVHCRQEIKNEQHMIRVNSDGDFVCGEKCSHDYKDERNHFFNEVIDNDKKFEEWMMN